MWETIELNGGEAMGNSWEACPRFTLGTDKHLSRFLFGLLFRYSKTLKV